MRIKNFKAQNTKQKSTLQKASSQTSTKHKLTNSHCYIKNHNQTKPSENLKLSALMRTCLTAGHTCRTTPFHDLQRSFRKFCIVSRRASFTVKLLTGIFRRHLWMLLFVGHPLELHTRRLWYFLLAIARPKFQSKLLQNYIKLCIHEKDSCNHVAQALAIIQSK